MPPKIINQDEIIQSALDISQKILDIQFHLFDFEKTTFLVQTLYENIVKEVYYFLLKDTSLSISSTVFNSILDVEIKKIAANKNQSKIDLFNDASIDTEIKYFMFNPHSEIHLQILDNLRYFVKILCANIEQSEWPEKTKKRYQEHLNQKLELSDSESFAFLYKFPHFFIKKEIDFELNTDFFYFFNIEQKTNDELEEQSIYTDLFTYGQDALKDMFKYWETSGNMFTPLYNHVYTLCEKTEKLSKIFTENQHNLLHKNKSSL